MKASTKLYLCGMHTTTTKGSWPALGKEAIKQRVFSALEGNVDFRERGESVLGVPASSLDPKVFYSNAPFLQDAPFLSALVANPNHIGCHTLGDSEPFFAGTHAIERELIDLCAHAVLGADEPCDGYVAAGGTEANIQAVWMHRNYFMKVYGFTPSEITLLCSADSHYSVFKAANLLGVKIRLVEVDQLTRAMHSKRIEEALQHEVHAGCKAVIAFCNMMTTMFGSVDDPKLMLSAIEHLQLPYRLHIDGAYGGFYQPFSGAKFVPDFRINEVHSITLDAHKMVQAPYGTGVFICRKGLMAYTCTDEASYVSGADFTLSGSRSGANAIAVWMILMTYGREGWEAKIRALAQRADRFSAVLSQLAIEHFRADASNILTMNASHIPEESAKRFGLVPDDHHNPQWFKIVVMDHVTDERLARLESELQTVLNR